ITSELKVKTTRLKPLTDCEDFDLQDFLAAQPSSPAYSDIFSLYRKLDKADNIVKDMCYAYADTIDKWWKFTEHVDSIAQESSRYICDYSQSMEVVKDGEGQPLPASFPLDSFYVDNGNYVNIGDWVWRRRDGKDKFSFDSDAEREWADILRCLSFRNTADGRAQAVKSVVTGKNNPNAGRVNIFNEVEPKKINPSNKFLWGKNYVYNSDIRFEYYLNGVHASYPDFIMKDGYDRIHIFEVKSVNISNAVGGGFDSEKYKAKVEALKKCYRHASVLTEHIFYLPVLKDDIWFITQFINGNERTITKEQFIDYIMTQQ
ncbi:MAG: hypothetical protein K2L88_01515, partial [Clostridiales bacterium]|nr:hypothetical protein [Clostridiales bacterium]